MHRARRSVHRARRCVRCMLMSTGACDFGRTVATAIVLGVTEFDTAQPRVTGSATPMTRIRTFVMFVLTILS